jgi:hypothetical protein
MKKHSTKKVFPFPELVSVFQGTSPFSYEVFDWNGCTLAVIFLVTGLLLTILSGPAAISLGRGCGQQISGFPASCSYCYLTILCREARLRCLQQGMVY